MTEIHRHTRMTNTGEALRGCLCLYVEDILKRESELHSGTVPDKFLPFYSPSKILYLKARQQEGLFSSKGNSYDGEIGVMSEDQKKNVQSIYSEKVDN